MNRFIFFTALIMHLFSVPSLCGQNGTAILPEDTTVYTVVEQMPVFPGGDQEMLKFINKSLRVPKDYEFDEWSPRAVASFVIEKDGTISNIEIVRPRNIAIERELVRIVKTMPVWEPGKQNNMPVRVKYSLPLHVHLR